MNFCCHDDYTGSNTFTYDDISIYIGFQNWVNGDASDPEKDIYNSDLTDLENFQAWYTSEVSSGNLNAIGQEITFLPKLDCGDFTESTTFTYDDISIYIGFQNWVNGDASDPEKDIYNSELNPVENFRIWYASEVSSGNLNAIGQEIKHLPSLPTDSVVHTIDGDIAKGGDGLTTEIDSETETAGDLLVSLDCPSAVHMNAEYEGDQKIKAIEIVFDNVEFTAAQNGETGLTITDAGKAATVNGVFKDTAGNPTLNYYYDYSIRTTGTEPRKNKSVIGFIDTSADGTGENKVTLGTLQFRVKSANYEIIDALAEEIRIADIRIYDETASVERYELISCGGEPTTNGDT